MNMKKQIKNFDEYFDMINESLAEDDNATCDRVFLNYSDDKPTKSPDGKLIPAKPIIRFADGGSVTPQEIVDVVQDAISYLKTQYRRTFYFANHTMNIVYLPHSKKYKTMAVNKSMTMYLNAGFVYNSLKMDPLLIAAVIMHEVFHVVYNHIERSENWLSAKGKSVTKSTWNDTNLAADVEVNQTLVKTGIISEDRLVNEIKGIFLSNKHGYHDILTLEMILNNEELMNELRAMHPVPPDPERKEREIIKTSDDWDGGYKDGWNSLGELVKKYGYEKIWDGLINSGLINQTGEIMVTDIKDINSKIGQMKDELEDVVGTMTFLQVKSYEDFINENNAILESAEVGQTYDDGYMSGFTNVVGIINAAINGGGGGGGGKSPKGPKIDTNVKKDDLIKLPPLPPSDDDNDDDDDDDNDDDNPPTNVNKQGGDKHNKKKSKSSDGDGDGEDSSDEELAKAAAKMANHLGKKSDSQDGTGEGNQSEDGEENAEDGEENGQGVGSDKNGEQQDGEDAGHGSFLNDDNDASDQDLADAGYSKEEIEELNKVRQANNQKNSPARLRKVLNDYRNQMNSTFLGKLLDKIEVESSKYKNIWEDILEKFLAKKTRRAGHDEKRGHNDWKKKKSIALGDYGVNRQRLSIDPQDVNIYVDVSGSMNETLLEIIAKSLVILSEKYEYSGINIVTWASKSAGPMQIDTMNEKGKDAIVADIMGAISLGRKTCGSSTEAEAILSGMLNGYEMNLKDPNKDTKDDVHVVITDGYVSGFAGIEKDIEDVLYHTFKRRDVAAKAPRNTIWMLYDTDESMLKEWESEIKKGKLISINSKNVINNSKKHK